MSSSVPTPAIVDIPVSFDTLKVPLVEYGMPIFQKSHEFEELQHDHPLDITDITSAQLWQPILESTVRSVSGCFVKKKALLASKQKVLTKRLEEILVGFADANYKTFNVGIALHLSGHVGDIVFILLTFFRSSNRRCVTMLPKEGRR